MSLFERMFLLHNKDLGRGNLAAHARSVSLAEMAARHLLWFRACPCEAWMCCLLCNAKLCHYINNFIHCTWSLGSTPLWLPFLVKVQNWTFMCIRLQSSLKSSLNCSIALHCDVPHICAACLFLRFTSHDFDLPYKKLEQRRCAPLVLL